MSSAAVVSGKSEWKMNGNDGSCQLEESKEIRNRKKWGSSEILIRLRRRRRQLLHDRVKLYALTRRCYATNPKQTDHETPETHKSAATIERCGETITQEKKRSPPPPVPPRSSVSFCERRSMHSDDLRSFLFFPRTFSWPTHVGFFDGLSAAEPSLVWSPAANTTLGPASALQSKNKLARW